VFGDIEGEYQGILRRRS